jgi:hypothetical protein
LNRLHNAFLNDFQIKFSASLLRALYDLINKQMYLFTYLITHCCFQPSKTDLNRLNECNDYIDEIFYEKSEYLLVKETMSNINSLLTKINNNNNNQCLLLKEICRFVIHDYIQNKKSILVQIEKTYLNSCLIHKMFFEISYLSFLFFSISNKFILLNNNYEA